MGEANKTSDEQFNQTSKEASESKVTEEAAMDDSIKSNEDKDLIVDDKMEDSHQDQEPMEAADVPDESSNVVLDTD